MSFYLCIYRENRCDKRHAIFESFSVFKTLFASKEQKGRKMQNNRKN